MAAVWQRHQLADATCRNVASFRGPPAGPPRCRRRCRPVPPLELKVVEERATVPSRPLCPFPFIPRGTARDQTEGSCFPEEGSVSSCFVVLRDTSPVSGSLILAIFVRRQFLSLSLALAPLLLLVATRALPVLRETANYVSYLSDKNLPKTCWV